MGYRTKVSPQEASTHTIQCKRCPTGAQPSIHGTNELRTSSILLHRGRVLAHLVGGRDLAPIMRVLADDDIGIRRSLLAIGVPACSDVVPSVARLEQAAVVMGKGVGFFAVDGKVADFEHLVRHAQRDPTDILDENHDQGGPHDVPADDEQSADDLEPDLLPVPCNGAARVGDTKGGAALCSCPKT